MAAGAQCRNGAAGRRDLRLRRVSSTVRSSRKRRCSWTASCERIAACSTLLDADYTFLNQRLAEHYGVPNVYGSQFRRVSITDQNRRGLLGQGSILTVTSYPNRTSVVQRGKWVLENLLGLTAPTSSSQHSGFESRAERQGAVDATADGSASSEPYLRIVSQSNGPDRFCT